MNKLTEIIILLIVIFGLTFLILSFTEDSAYEIPYKKQLEQNNYEECIPDPVWGSCLP